MFAVVGLVNGLDDIGSLPDSLLGLSQQSVAVACPWSATAPQCSGPWSDSGESHHNEWMVSNMAESSARQINSSLFNSSSLPVSSAVTDRQLVMPATCRPDTVAVPMPLSSHSVAQSSLSITNTSAGAQHCSSLRSACQVELHPAETSLRNATNRLSTNALELGNVHLRDLLSQDYESEAKPSIVQYHNNESPQEPQSTSCDDDPPDSSTGNGHGGRGGVSILKQLLTDSDSDDQNEVSASEPETTNNEPHVLLKVCLFVSVSMSDMICSALINRHTDLIQTVYAISSTS